MAITNTSFSLPNNQEKSQKKYLVPLINITLLFFVFGFITSMNDTLVLKLKKAFELNYLQTMLIQFCFFFAYFITSLAYYILSITKGDIIVKIGYKNIIIFGFLLSSIGSALFYPASLYHSYSLFLFALFILASGFAMLQISANPYVTLLGKSENASGRLILTQSFNSIGTTIAPLIGGMLILDSTLDGLSSNNSTHSLKMPYIIITSMLVLMAFIIKISHLPKITSIPSSKNSPSLLNTNLIKKHRQLKYGIIGIFMYVGGEVSIGSFFLNYILSLNMNISEAQAAKFLSLFWGGIMIGRFLGAIFLSSHTRRKNLLIIITLIGSIIYSSWILNFKMEFMIPYILLIMLNLIGFFLGKNLPHRNLSLFSFILIIALFLGVFAPAKIAMWSIISTGLFNSIMFPTIFSLSIRGIDENEAPRSSSLLIMAVVGGALIPLIQGYFADIFDVKHSYLIPILCYLYIIFFGLTGYKKHQELKS